ncbi:DUF2268 domain-containing protein [Rossellomorea sp. DUT-2]|uniref:DUF2268 domain-containing protein n=1 Tax=Rossellomorea sp. DUT-2 TaxID=3412021 RepID=UPI003D17CEBE
MKPLGKTLLIPLISLLFISCSNDQPVHLKEQESPITFSQDKQEFEIFYMYDEMKEYINSVREKSGSSNETVYIEKVFEPFKELSDIEGFSLAYPFEGTYELDKLEESIVALTQDKDSTDQIIKESLINSAEQLPGENKKIIVLPANPEDTLTVEEMGGVEGVVLAEDVIVLKLSASFDKDILKYTVAHEYNHAIEGESNDGMMHTILGAVVMEGKADVFASILYPQIEVPWKEPMNTETKEKVVKELMELADSSDPRLYLGLRSGNPSKGIPQWANYKIGFEIVQSYIKNHPEVSVGKWTSMHEQEIIAGSDYTEIN